MRYLGIQAYAVDHIELIREVTLSADRGLSYKAHAQFVPGGGLGKHRYSPVYETPPREIPQIVIMVEVKAAQRDQDSAAAETCPVGEVILEPGLLEGDFGVVGACDRL